MKFGFKGSMPLILPNPPITALLFPNFAADTEQMHETYNGGVQRNLNCMT
jgi:hypothetical protein